MNLWEKLQAILKGEKFKIKNDAYIINRFLSFSQESIILSIGINRYIGIIPDWAVQNIYETCIQHRKNPSYIKYPRKTKTKEKVLTEKISRHLCCNENHARQTIELLRKNGHKPEIYFGLKKDE